MIEITKLLLIVFLLSGNQLISQTSYPVTFQIIDSKSGFPLENASVSIKEIGFQSKLSGNDGNIYFSTVPLGEIHFFVTKTGYNGIEGVMNITTKGKDNTKRISLAKIPEKETKFVLVTGEVIDNEGKEIPNAQIEIRAGKLQEKTITDESGDYIFELDTDEIIYNVNNFSIEIKKGDCKVKESLPIPKQNYLYKDFKLACKSKKSNNDNNSIPSNSQELITDHGDWEFKITKVVKKFNAITIHFTVLSKERDKILRLFGQGGPVASVIYDDTGSVHTASALQIANQNILTYNDVRLIAGVPIKGKISYQNIPKSVQSIPIVKFLYNIADYGKSFQFYSNTMEFRNIKLN